MIKKPTVLVLGAGASHPYGFPLGGELVDRLIANLKGDLELLRRLIILGYDPPLIETFRTELNKARPFSLDAFLETRREFREVGKAAMADELLQYEARSIGLPLPPGDWYRYLLNKFLLLTSPDHFTQQARRLTVVTFNFDRSFERALFDKVSAQFGVSDAEARRLATELQIHHVHGVLGLPNWLYDEPAEDLTPYGASGDELLKWVPIAVNSIRMVDDDIEQAVIEDIEAALRKAEFVYFIGFGFDERNLAKLGAPDSVRAATVRGTALRWTALERNPVERYFARNSPTGRGIHLYDDADAYTFVSKYAETLFD